jgi:hypothetical protein
MDLPETLAPTQPINLGLCVTGKPARQIDALAHRHGFCSHRRKLFLASDRHPSSSFLIHGVPHYQDRIPALNKPWLSQGPDTEVGHQPCSPISEALFWPSEYFFSSPTPTPMHAISDPQPGRPA